MNENKIDYKKCCLCQDETNRSSIRCPAKDGFETSYDKLEGDLLGFKALGQNPIPVQIALFGENIAYELKSNIAFFHYSCRKLCDTQKLKRAQKRKEKLETECLDNSPQKKTRRSFNASLNNDEPECIICSKNNDEEPLHKAMTKSLDDNIKEWAKACQDYNLLTKLETASDMPAMEAYYHKSCSTNLFNKARPSVKIETSGNKVNEFNESVMVHVAACVSASTDKIFTLKELKGMYIKRLGEIDPDSRKTQSELHSTRFKERLLLLDPDLTETCAGGGHSTLISHKYVQAEAVNKKYKTQHEMNSNVEYIEAAQSLHKVILNHKIKPFTGSFTPDCLTDDIPVQLVDFINRLVQGPIVDKEQEVNKQRERAVKIICHQIVYNTIKRPTSCTTVMRHNKSRIPSYPIYQGLKLHTEGKMKTQIEQHKNNGSSIGY